MKKTEHDFLKFISWPSSLKIINSVMGEWQWWVSSPLEIPSEATIDVELMAAQQNVTDETRPSSLVLAFWDGKTWGWLTGGWKKLPLGSFDFSKFTLRCKVPLGITTIRAQLAGGPPGSTWFDDLRIHQDGVLIYSDDFSNWNPIIGAGVGAPIGGVAGYLLKEPLGPMVSEAIGAVLGGALGGGVGLLTGLGIIPVPQIPTLGATPGESVAPARLGKYLVTG